MPADWIAIVAAGLAATFVLTVVMLLATAAGLARLNFPMLLGTFFTQPGPSALAIGLAWHVVNGIVFAALYWLAFRALAIEPSWTMGIGLGLVHTLIAGGLLGLVSGVHPRVRAGQMPAPRAFGSRYGLRGETVLLVAHLCFGAVVGAIL